MRAFVHRHLSYANVMATIAVFVAIGGSAFAANYVITKSSQIKDGAVTGADVKNSSLTGSDIKDSGLTNSDIKDSSLTGSDIRDKSLTPADFNGSVQGPQGPKGDPGPQGQSGLPFVHSAVFGTDRAVFVPGGWTWITLRDLRLPVGSYVARAVVHIAAGASTEARCQLGLGYGAPPGYYGWAFTAEGFAVAGSGVTLAMERAATLSIGGNVKVVCEAATDVTADQLQLTAESVGDIAES